MYVHGVLPIGTWLLLVFWLKALKVLWWIALASMIRNSFRFSFSFYKCLVCFGSVRLMNVWSMNPELEYQQLAVCNTVKFAMC